MTAKQKRFCEEYVIDLNGKAAAVRAGYGKKSADARASILLSMPFVKEYISALQHEIMERNNISADMVVQELAALGFYNIQDFTDDDNDIVSVKKAERNKMKPVVGIETTVRFVGGGKDVDKIVTTKLKLADKTNALIHLGKHLGIFEKDNNQKSMKIKVTRK